MKRLLLIVLLTATVFVANAQNKTANSLTYKSAFGVKIWNGGGLTLKTFINPKTAIEITGFYRGQGTRIGVLYEIHGDLNSEGNLKWYLGPGVHAGFYKFDNVIKTSDGTYLGVSGVAGADYKFTELPINISLDWQPTIEIFKGKTYFENFGGLSVRYTF
jgi:hypothetical protein